jgi:hypothetical protein
MTTVAERNKVIEMISQFPITVETPPGLDVMNVKRLADVFLGDTAPLTSEIVALASRPGLSFPVWATLVCVATQPNGTIWPGRITGFSLPLNAALNIAKSILAPYIAFQAKKCFTAIMTGKLLALYVLRMIFAARGVYSFPLCLARFGAKAFVEFINTACGPNNHLLTVGAWHFFAGGSSRIPAGSGAILLFAVIVGCGKRFTAMTAQPLEVLSPGFVGACDRAEPDHSVGSFFNGLAAKFACIHSTIVP